MKQPCPQRFLPPIFIILIPMLAFAFFTGCDSGPTGAQQERATTTATATAAAAIPDQLRLAEIDGQPVTGADLKKYLGLFKDPQSQLPREPAACRLLLEHLVNRKLLLEAATRSGYDKLDELKKHGSLGPVEKETIILRAFLNDRISRPATPDKTEVSAYREKHPDLSLKQAREALAAKKQKALFRQLMAELRQEHKIVIHLENLARLPASGS